MNKVIQSDLTLNNCALPSCGEEVPQTPGKKQRKYCNDQCKQRHWHQKKQEAGGMVKISREELEDLKRKAYPEIAVDFGKKDKTVFSEVKNVNGKLEVKEISRNNYLQKRRDQKLK